MEVNHVDNKRLVAGRRGRGLKFAEGYEYTNQFHFVLTGLEFKPYLVCIQNTPYGQGLNIYRHFFMRIKEGASILVLFLSNNGTGEILSTDSNYLTDNGFTASMRWQGHVYWYALGI